MGLAQRSRTATHDRQHTKDHTERSHRFQRCMQSSTTSHTLMYISSSSPQRGPSTPQSHSRRGVSDRVRLRLILVANQRGPDREDGEDGDPEPPVLRVAKEGTREHKERERERKRAVMRTVAAICILNEASSIAFVARAVASCCSVTASRPSGRHCCVPSSRDDISFDHAVSQSTLYSLASSGLGSSSGESESCGVVLRRNAGARHAAMAEDSCNALAVSARSRIARLVRRTRIMSV